MLTHFNPFQCSICGETRWLVFTSEVCGGRLCGVNFKVKMYVIDLYLCLECCLSGGVFSRILLVETGHLVSLYISNFKFYFIYKLTISFNFHSNFNIYLRNIWGYLELPWCLGRDFLWRRLTAVPCISLRAAPSWILL